MDFFAYGGDKLFAVRCPEGVGSLYLLRVACIIFADVVGFVESGLSPFAALASEAGSGWHGQECSARAREICGGVCGGEYWYCMLDDRWYDWHYCVAIGIDSRGD